MMLYLFGQLALSDSLHSNHDFSEDDFQRLVRARGLTPDYQSLTTSHHAATASRPAAGLPGASSGLPSPPLDSPPSPTD